MKRKKVRGLVVIVVLFFVVFWVAIFGARNIDAQIGATPTLYATNWNYLPFVSGVNRGPTATATLPAATRTPWATITNTPTAATMASATATNRPSATATNTPAPTATETVRPPGVPAPEIFDIENEDQDGNYTVSWTAVDGAEIYKLKQNIDETVWNPLYEGPFLLKELTNMAPGEYCYIVRAFAAIGHSDWSEQKCTTVLPEVETEYDCKFDTLYDGPRTAGSDIELLFDGRLFITQTAPNAATIFDPGDRSFTTVTLPDGGGNDAAVLADGRVLLTVDGTDPHSMIYDPDSGGISRLDELIECLAVYRNQPFGLMTYCKDNHGYAYSHIGSPTQDIDISEYQVEIEATSGIQYRAFVNDAHESGSYYSVLVTNGIVGNTVVSDDGSWLRTTTKFNHRVGFQPPSNGAAAISADRNTVYFSGGTKTYSGVNDTSKDAHASHLDGTLVTLANMVKDRGNQAMVGLADGNLLVLGGFSGDWYYSQETKLRDIEIYIPAENKWYRAGSLNIAREGHQVIQLLNGEIFVYGGATDPGPGYAFMGPPEIGHCERRP